jgi:hypothetical protein
MGNKDAFQPEMRDLALIFGGKFSFDFRIVLEALAEKFENGGGALYVRWRDETVAEFLLIFAGETGKFAYGLDLAGDMTACMRPESLEPVFRIEAPPNAVSCGKNLPGIGKRVGCHLVGPAGGTATVKQIRFMQFDHPFRTVSHNG